MINPKPCSILLVGVDKEIRPGLAAAFEAVGGKAHCLDVPFVVPTDGAGIVSTAGEARLIEELDRACQAIGHIDVLVNSVSLDAHLMTTPLPTFTAVYTSALMQLSRPMTAVLPGMIIRQRGHMITLVTSGSDVVDAETYNAVITAAATIAKRVSDALKGDRIRSDVLLHRSSFSGNQKKSLIEALVGVSTTLAD